MAVTTEASEGKTRQRSRARLLVPVVLLALLPAAALLGLTSRKGELTVTADGMQASLHWPLVTRVYRPGLLELEVRATGDSPLTAVQAALPLEFLNLFSDVASEPAAERLENGQFLIELGDIPPGESRSVRLELRPNSGHYLRTSVTVSHTGAESVLYISQLTLP